MAIEPLRRQLRTCAHPQCVERVHSLLAELWVAAPGVGDEDRIAFETAIAEVTANVVQHAAAGQEIRLDLEVVVRPDRLEASFCDEGRAADVDVDAVALPDELAESGRGLALARAMLDELAYERDGDVNRWRLVRRRRRS